MKSRLCLLFVVAMLLHACVTTKTYSTEEKKMVDANAGVYIQKDNKRSYADMVPEGTHHFNVCHACDNSL